MYATCLKCVDCGETQALGPSFLGCDRCRDGRGRGALEVVYDLDAIRSSQARSWDEPYFKRMWKYAELLPVEQPADVVSLGEGSTPLLHLDRDGTNPLENLYVKVETVNPSSAFKDRFHSVSISMAKELGFGGIVASTTGNHGVSLASYARAGGMQAVVFADTRCPPHQRAAMRALGATVIVKKNRRESLAMFVKQHGWYPSTYMTPMPVSTPYGVEGYKTMAFEVVQDLGDAPEHFFFPTAAGDGFYGPWKGFREFEAIGVSTHSPAMHAVQAKGANWLVETWKRKASEALATDSTDTIAVSIGDASGGFVCMKAIDESGGSAVAIDDREILGAERYLASRGLLVEPSSAAGVAGAWAKAREAEIPSDAVCVCVLTGSAFKWPEALELLADDAPAELMEPSADEIGSVANGLRGSDA